MTDSLTTNDTGDLAEVFSDVSTHMLVSGIIRDQLTNSLDVREEAFRGLDLSGCRTVLDIGCGFGFFSGGLAGKLGPDAEITGIDRYEKYRNPYMETAGKAGLKSNFISEGISAVNHFDECSYDMVICSYALYFFPDFIPEVARILKDDGMFVVITHSCPHMKELTYLVNGILASENMPHERLLPYEMLINRFCDHNGTGLLAPWFSNISRKEFRSEIVFTPPDFDKFAEYFRFKFPFFIPCGKKDEKKLTDLILHKVNQLLEETGSFIITKDDTIFICSKPVKNKTR